MHVSDSWLGRAFVLVSSWIVPTFRDGGVQRNANEHVDSSHNASPSKPGQPPHEREDKRNESSAS